MIIVTVLREKLVHSETIGDNQQSNQIRVMMTFDSQDRVQFSFTSVNNRKWIIIKFLRKWKSMTSISVHFIDRSMRFKSQPINYSFSWLNLKWTDPQTFLMTIKTNHFKSFSLFFCVFFLFVYFFQSLVDMLNPCVCRFVVNQKEKYWANHSWRWASVESMESLFSGGLQVGGQNHHNKNKIKDKKKTSQDRSRRKLIIFSLKSER